MSQMLQAQADVSAQSDDHELDKPKDGGTDTDSPTSLVLRLKQIFGFEDTEAVISGV